MVNVGEQIRIFRERRGWSQAQLADKARVSRSHLNRIENGLSNPTTAFLEKIELTLGIKTGTLTQPGDIVHAEDIFSALPDDVKAYISSKDGQRVIKLLADARLSAETLEYIIKGVRAAQDVERRRNM